MLLTKLFSFFDRIQFRPVVHCEDGTVNPCYFMQEKKVYSKYCSIGELVWENLLGLLLKYALCLQISGDTELKSTIPYINNVRYFWTILHFIAIRLKHGSHKILDPFSLWPWRHLWTTPHKWMIDKYCDLTRNWTFEDCKFLYLALEIPFLIHSQAREHMEKSFWTNFLFFLTAIHSIIEFPLPPPRKSCVFVV